MILTAYLDESGTHGGSAYTVLAGFIGSAQKWDEFESKWRVLLTVNGLRYIHTKQLVKGGGQFKKWSDAKREWLAVYAPKIAEECAMFVISTILQNDDYKHLYIGHTRLNGVPIDSPYGLCFRLCLQQIITVIRQNSFWRDVELHIVMEQGHKNAGDAVRIFDGFKRYGDPESSAIARTISFATKQEAPPLQAADLLAYACYRQEVDRKVEVAEEAIETLNDMENQRCRIIRMPATSAVLLELRGKLEAAIADRKARGQRRPKISSDA
jgi:hypothetical protein